MKRFLYPFCVTQVIQRVRQTRCVLISLFMALLFSANAFAAKTVLSSITIDGNEYALYTGFTATDGTKYVDNFDYSYAVDGNLSTKWRDIDPASGYSYIEFSSDVPIILKGYILNSYNAIYYHPTDRRLYAKANENDEYVLVSSYTNADYSTAESYFPVVNEDNNQYRYFRFEGTNSAQNIGLYEIRLYGENELTYGFMPEKSATCTATGIKQDCYLRSDGKYFTDETGAKELSNEDVIAPIKPHNFYKEDGSHTAACIVCGAPNDNLEVHDFSDSDGNPLIECICGKHNPFYGYCGDPEVNEGKDVTWRVTQEEDGNYTMTISGTGKMKGYNVIPDIPWRKYGIGNYQKKITRFIVSEGVTSVGQSACYEFEGLKYIELSNSVTYISFISFEKCTSLEYIKIPSSVTTIEFRAFNECPALTKVEIPCTLEFSSRWNVDESKVEKYHVFEKQPFIDGEDGTHYQKCKCANTTSTPESHAFNVEDATVDGANVSAATCTEKAKYYKSCVCGALNTSDVFEAGEPLGHSWGEYTLVGDQTCTYDGHKTAECTREGCSEENKIVATGAALGHLFTEYLSNGDANEAADGHKTAECDRGCGVTHTVIDEGSRIRYLCSIGIHNFSEEIVNDDTKKSGATCTEKAKYYKSCSACGALSTSDVFEVGEPLGHLFTEYLSNGDATCFADGTKSAKCDNGCGETNTVADEGSMLDHTFGLLSEEANSDGLYEKKCIHHCGNTIYTIKDALGEGKHIDLIKNSSDQYEMAEDDLVLNDNGSFSSPVNFNVRGSVAYSRLANKDTMTIILPYDVPASDVNGQAYQLASFDGQTLKYEKVNDGLKANVPYLIYKNRGGETNLPLVADQNEATVHATATIDTVRVNDGKTIEFGAFTQTVFLSGDNSNEFDFYGYKNGKFIKAKKDITVSPFRVAVRLTKPSMGNRNMSLRSYSINPNELGVVFDDDVTGVDIYDSNIISEGKVNVYDVLGRAIRLNVDAENCLDGLKDGVYVVNGNKVIIKTDKQ